MASSGRPVGSATSAVGFLLAAVLLLGAAASAPAADRGLVRRLEREIAKIPYVDSHSHVPAPQGIAKMLEDGKYDLPYLLGRATYVAEFTYGGNWEELKESLQVNAHHAYYRVMVAAMRDLYGLRGELDEESFKEVSSRMDAAHRKPGWYAEVLRRANVKHVVWLGADGRGRESVPGPEFHPVWGIDGFVFVAGKEKQKKGEKEARWRIDALRESAGDGLEGLGDMEKLVEKRIAAFFEKGGVGLKSTAAYFRKLDFDTGVARKDAAAAFKKVLARRDLRKEEEKLLQDYLMTKVLQQAAKHQKPVQFHTGNQQNWGMLPWCDPTELNPLLYTGELWDAKFVLLHGGYPFSRDAITLVRYFGNAYLDLAWMVLFSPEAARSVLSEALDILDGGHLMLGTDTASLEGMYGTVKFTRRVLAEVLADKIEKGYWTEEVALQAARRILYHNAVDLYGLED